VRPPLRRSSAIDPHKEQRPVSNARLEKLVWALIYGGLLVVCLGIFTERADAVLGWALVGIGALAAVAGALLIYVRSTRQEP
jgi:hypothetical protein